MDINTNSQNPENQNSDNLVISQPPAVQPAVVRSSRSRKIIFYIVILVLILAILGAAVYFFVKNGKTKKSPITPPEQSQAVKDAILASQETGGMLTLSPITFPKIASQTTILLAQIPKDLAGLVLPDAKGLQTLQVTLNNQQTGFRLIYGIPEPVQDVHAKYIPATGWTKLKSAVSDLAGIAILENQAFQVECIETSLSASYTRISILGVKK
jgi:hypothetical protein